jgi:hypothetical protein
MTLQEGTYGVQYMVSRYAVDSIPWEYIKRQLDEIMLRDVFAPMIGDGLYHVIKADYLKDDNYPIDAIIYYAKIHHTIAQIQNIVIPSMVNIPETARFICRWCGNVLKLDKRGGCMACGAPPGNDWMGGQT